MNREQMTALVAKTRIRLGRLYKTVEVRLFPLHAKEREEIEYWKSRLAIEGKLSNERYLQSYTSTFDIEPSF
jgi:hypothetical protein